MNLQKNPLRMLTSSWHPITTGTTYANIRNLHNRSDATSEWCNQQNTYSKYNTKTNLYNYPIMRMDDERKPKVTKLDIMVPELYEGLETEDEIANYPTHTLHLDSQPEYPTEQTYFHKEGIRKDYAQYADKIPKTMEKKSWKERHWSCTAHCPPRDIYLNKKNIAVPHLLKVMDQRKQEELSAEVNIYGMGCSIPVEHEARFKKAKDNSVGTDNLRPIPLTIVQPSNQHKDQNRNLPPGSITYLTAKASK